MYNSPRKATSPGAAGRKKRKLRSTSLAAAGVVFYLVLLAGVISRLRDYPPLDGSEHRKRLSEFFEAPRIRIHDDARNSSKVRTEQEVSTLEKLNSTSNSKGQKNGGIIWGKPHNTENGKDQTNQVGTFPEKLRFKLDRASKNVDHRHQYLPLWELSDILPPWMKEYFAWHRTKRQTLTEEVWHQWKKSTKTNILDASVSGSKFLVVQCMQINIPRAMYTETFSNETSLFSCGNLMERLGLLPYWVRMAHETNRILFFHWTVPTDLSEYLEPPVGGCDWRAPMWLQQLVRWVVHLAYSCCHFLIY